MRTLDWLWSVRDHCDLPPTVQHVALAIGLRANRDCLATVTVSQLVADTGLGRTAVKEAIKQLTDAGWIDRQPGGRGKHGHQAPNTYGLQSQGSRGDPRQGSLDDQAGVARRPLGYAHQGSPGDHKEEEEIKKGQATRPNPPKGGSGSPPKPRAETYGDTLRRAMQSGHTECPHGEPRGHTYCALCRHTPRLRAVT